MPHLDDYEAEVDRIASRFESAETVVYAVLTGISADATAGELEQAATLIASVLSETLSFALSHIDSFVPVAYRQGMMEAAEAMAVTTPERVVRELVNQKPVFQADLDLLRQNLVEDMARATSFMEADAKRTLREIGRNRLSASLASTNPAAQVPNFRAQMEEWSLAFVDRANRKWEPGVYARNVLMYQTGIVLNSASVNTGIALGSPGVRVFDGDYDETCREADGQYWSLAFALANPLHHPHCKRSFSPLPPSWIGELDRVLEGESKEVDAR